MPNARAIIKPHPRHKQYMRSMVPRESWGKERIAYSGDTRPLRFSGGSGTRDYAWLSVSVKRGATTLIARRIAKAGWDSTFGELLHTIDSSILLMQPGDRNSLACQTLQKNGGVWCHCYTRFVPFPTIHGEPYFACTAYGEGVA